jgi:hypothetical protein
MAGYETRLWINGEYAKPQLGKTYPLHVRRARLVLKVSVTLTLRLESDHRRTHRRCAYRQRC